MTPTPPDVKSIFGHALEIESAAGRAAYLAEACGGDAGLRAEVEGLLAVLGRAGEFMCRPAAADVTADGAPVAEGPGARVGPYKLLQQIGQGGMGVVYMAEQAEPVRRQVALKIIKPGMDSKQVVARFEAERQALALMDHTNIARILDAGTTDGGRPYFVMELVHGVPITTFCDQNQLPLRERLALFVSVCRAIQHAHQKGVIHRDVKPSNILVTRYDDKPVPKVIDFGVAKAVARPLTEQTLFTQFGAMVGTFEYMSPEQAEMNALGVDTRSDVYSLGVLLYELLTGTPPLERSRLREAAFGEVVRMIKEVEPPRPSVRLSTSGDRAKVAADRRSDPGKLSRLVRGELDCVVMRCLEKDRSRRYDTVSGLANDVEHYLNDEPVEARPPSVGYRLWKFVRRHRAAAAAAAAVATALVLGAAAATGQAVRATRAERRAEAERDRVTQALADAEQARLRETEAKAVALAGAQAEARAMRDRVAALKQVQTEAAIAQEVNQFLLVLFIRAGDTRPGQPFTLQAFLEGAARRLDARHPEQPLAEAAIHELLAQGFHACGQAGPTQRHWDRAYQLRKQHLGEADPKTLVSLWWLGSMYDLYGQHGQAEASFQTLRDTSRAAYGAHHEATRRATFHLALACKHQKKYARAEPLLVEYAEAERARDGAESLQAWTALAQLGQCYLEEGKYKQAEDLLLRLVGDAPQVRIQGRPAEKNMVNPVYHDLVKLYDAWHKPTEAARWRKELEKGKAPELKP